MLVHDNGNLNVLSMKKCGHVAMTYYFDMIKPPTCNYIQWISNPSPKILVVRHPVERMHAAINWHRGVFETRLEEYYRTGTCDRMDLIEDLIGYENPQPYIDEYIFNQHCRPYMHIFRNRDFRIIMFENLSRYIPKITDLDTKTRNRNLDPFPINRYFSRYDMLDEIQAYETILQTKEVITPEEWKALT